MVARRKENERFDGIITNNDFKKKALSLNFLPKKTSFVACSYSDDETINTKTKGNSGEILKNPLVASGGEAIWIKPIM